MSFTKTTVEIDDTTMSELMHHMADNREVTIKIAVNKGLKLYLEENKE